ncbi:MAG TPA: N-acetyltransferase [Bacteroidales bacterium]|nr:N-acetyltransferase [Bacteroidales bacterium]
MISEDNFNINISTDPAEWAVCAEIMAGTDPWITLGMDYEQCLPAFGGIHREVYVMQKGEQVAGFVILQVLGTFAGYIQTLCIDESWRGKGLGTMLLNFSEQKIFGFSPNIFICVSSFNKRAIKLYYDFGFKLVGELDNFVKEGFSELLMRKTKGPRVGYQCNYGK